jgi:hypothetical protein
MIRAMHHDHGLSPDSETEDRTGRARLVRGDAPKSSRVRRWAGEVASFLALR